VLRGDWWRRDNGPLVARRRTGDRAATVALLPASSSSYELVDPESGERVAVDRRVAAELGSEAHMFYTPLPARRLGLRDLLRAGLRGRGRDLAVLAAVSAALGMLGLLLPVVTARVIGESIPRADRSELLVLTLALIVGALSAALFQVARGVAVLRLTGKLDFSLQAAVWDRLMSMPVSFFRRFTVGDLERRAMGIDHLRTLLASQVTSAVLTLVYSLFSFAILFHYSWRLALVATAIVALLALFAAAVAVSQLRHQRALHRARGRVASLLFAVLSGIAKLRVAGAEGRAFAAWAERFAEQRHHTVEAQRLAIASSVAGAVVGVLSTLAIFAMVGLSHRLELGLGAFLAFNAAYGQFQAAALATLGVLPAMLEAVPVYERLKPILVAAPEADDSKAEAPELRGELEMKGVSFRYYAGGKLVLDGVDLRVGAGELVALVGPSGSGKSTCLRLLLGFERPLAGQVLYDGQDLSSLDVHSVRRQIGVVLQNGKPLVGDVYSNIVGSRNLTLDDAWEAARMVGMEAEITAMPMGMHTFINQRGTTFSGGQRQRILIARAIVNRPRIVLLDEATSALDNRTQALVIRSLEELQATRLVIAHRLSTIANADRIYVLDQGRIVETGTYEELVRLGGFFTRIVERQIA
jgi:ATP-binding cassette subfamily C protein